MLISFAELEHAQKSYYYAAWHLCKYYVKFCLFFS